MTANTQSMKNPNGETWYVEDPAVDETGRFPVAAGYWQPTQVYVQAGGKVKKMSKIKAFSVYKP